MFIAYIKSAPLKKVIYDYLVSLYEKMKEDSGMRLMGNFLNLKRF